MLSAVPPEMIAPALQKAGFRVEFGKSLSELGTFQLGGPLQALVCCEDPRQLEILRGLLHREGLPALLIGEGSNLLFSDAGWPGLMVRYVSENCRPEAVGSGLWKVSASVSLQELVSWSVREGWAGLEAFSGIPGTLGGAVVGNAGAWGVQMEHVVFEVRGVDSGGTTHLLSNAECGFRYRDSLLKDGELWISEVLLQLRPGDAADLTRERERILEVRAAKHPDWRKEP
ncbi:MAG: UDP-N-acetylmuramate dehydrogenase, partial [Kiritimatiellia bacterium]